jgi:hypothetical protein
MPPILPALAQKRHDTSIGALHGNLRRNPTVILTTGCNQWDRGLDVVVEGEAVQVTAEGGLERLAVERAKRSIPAASPWSSTARELDAILLRVARGLHPGNRPACRVNGRGIRGAGSAC